MSFLYRQHKYPIRVYFSIDVISGITSSGGISSTSSQMQQNETKVKDILEHIPSNESEIVPLKKIEDLTISDIEKVTYTIPLLIKIKDGAYISIIATAKQDNGTVLYTVRYGIDTVSPEPAYDGISLLAIHPDGTISSQQPIANLKTEYSEQEYVTYNENFATYKKYREILIFQLGEQVFDAPIFNPANRIPLEKRSIQHADCKIYQMGVNNLNQQIFLLTLSKKGDNKVGLQLEIRKVKDDAGNHALYLGSLVKGATIENIGEAFKWILSQSSFFELTPSTNIIFHRDDTHGYESVVRKVSVYMRIFPPNK